MSMEFTLTGAGGRERRHPASAAPSASSRFVKNVDGQAKIRPFAPFPLQTSPWTWADRVDRAAGRGRRTYFWKSENEGRISRFDESIYQGG